MNHTRFRLGIVKIRPLLIRPHDLGVQEKIWITEKDNLDAVSRDLSDHDHFIYAALWGQDRGLWKNVSVELMEALYVDRENSALLMRNLHLSAVEAPIHMVDASIDHQ